MPASIPENIWYEWDDNKNEKNVSKHGLDFETAILIWDSATVTGTDDRDYGNETRFIALGQVDGRVVAVVFTWREGTTRRIISARKASRDERRKYRETTRRGEADPPD